MKSPERKAAEIARQVERVIPRHGRRRARRIARDFGLAPDVFYELLYRWAGRQDFRRWVEAGGSPKSAPAYMLADIEKARAAR